MGEAGVQGGKRAVTRALQGGFPTCCHARRTGSMRKRRRRLFALNRIRRLRGTRLLGASTSADERRHATHSCAQRASTYVKLLSKLVSHLNAFPWWHASTLPMYVTYITRAAPTPMYSLVEALYGYIYAVAGARRPPHPPLLLKFGVSEQNCCVSCPPRSGGGESKFC